ncbi:hypothetical protein EB001_10030 [bacterium]|nr:hypothetical protein [bacterium]
MRILLSQKNSENQNKGYDADSSITKKLRKPEQVIPIVLNEGKVGLRKVMGAIKTAENKANGRINEESILLRIIK